MLPAIIAMAQSPHRDEIRLLIEAAYPQVDARVAPRPEVLVKHIDRDRDTDEHIGRLIPGPAHRRRRITAEAHDRTEQILVAMLVSGGNVDLARPGDVVQQRVSLRQMAELTGITHQRVHQIVVSHGERTQTLVRIQPTRCNTGQGRVGINNGTGRRRGAPAHPATLYQYTVSEAVLQRAREYVEAHGYPETVFPVQIVNPPTLNEDDRAAAAETLAGIITTLVESGHSPERIRHLLSDLEPAGLCGQSGRPTLILKGWIHYRALELIHAAWPHDVLVLLE